MAKKTKAEKMLTEISGLIRKYNVPAIAVVGDHEGKRTGVVMDVRKDMSDLNIAILLDAMVNSQRELLNLVMRASAHLLAMSPSFMQPFLQHIEDVRKAQEEATKIVHNTAEA
jgi:hypothetical protein